MSMLQSDTDSKVTLDTLATLTAGSNSGQYNTNNNNTDLGPALCRLQTLTVPEDRQYVVGEPTDLDKIRTRDTVRSHRLCRGGNVNDITQCGGRPAGAGKSEKDEEKALESSDGADIVKLEGKKTGGSSSDDSNDGDDEFLVDWEGPDDPNNPMNWSQGYRFFCLITAALQTLVVVFNSSVYLSGSQGMMRDFGVESRTIIVLGLTTYLCGLAVAPLLLAPLSEMYGRRIVYITCLGMFVILVIPSCVATNMQTIIVTRFFAAFVGSATLSNAPGTVADLFPPEYRSTAFAVFAVAPFNGPSFGPLFGGILYEYLGWRSINYTVVIFAGIMWIVGFFVKETYGPHLLRQKAQQKRTETGDDRYHSRFDFQLSFGSLLWTNLTRPIVMLFTEAICASWAVYIAVIYSILYMSFVAYPVVFGELRGWAPKYAGLPFLGMCVGTFLGIAFDPIARWGYNRHKVDPETGKPPPEALIWSVCFAAFLSPLGLIIFAWTSDPRICEPYIVSILAGIPFGLGTSLIFIHGSNYLLNSYSIYAASSGASNTLARSILGGVLPLIAPRMYTALSPAIAGTILAVMAAVLIPIPWIFYKWGKQIRERSPLLMALAKEGY